MQRPLSQEDSVGRIEPEVMPETIPEAIPGEYSEVIELLENFLRSLDNRLETAHTVLPELQEKDTLQYVEAHALYRELLWQWQRARLALLILRLEHPNYDTRALTTMEGERDEGRSRKT